MQKNKVFLSGLVESRGVSRLFFLVLLFGVLVPVSGCRAVGTREKPPSESGRLNACLARRAPAAFDAAEAKKCIALIERFLRADENNPAADRAALQLGRFYMARKDFPAAYNLLLHFQEKYPESRKRALAVLYLGICLYHMENYTESLSVLRDLLKTPEAAPVSGEVSLYIAENYVKLRRLLPALSWYQKREALAEDEDTVRNTQRRVLKVVCAGWQLETLVRAEELFPDGFFHEAVLLGLAANAFQNGQSRLAKDRLQDLSSRHPDDVFTPFLKEFLSRTEPAALPEGCTVGCLLPLTGKYGRFGRGILDALILGAGAFQDEGSGGARVRLLVRDTGGDPARASKELQDLAANPEVVGIVGPLEARVAQECAPVAQAAGIPMISLSQREDVALAGDFVFQNGLTARQQVDTLVDYAVGNLGASRLAILYPDDEYGVMTKDLYKAKVTEMGGQVVSAVFYGKRETDFQDEIHRLVGERYWEEMKEREKRQKERDRLRRRAMSGGMEESGVSNSGIFEEEEQEDKPVPPFEVLFVPDHYKKASLIASYLAFYDLDDIVLLGNNAWNSVDLLKEVGEYVRSVVFVDGFFAESGLPQAGEFAAAFERDFDRKPGVLEAQAYDSLLLLVNASSQAQSKGREGVRDALMSVKDYQGLSGATSFGENRCAKNRLYLLTFKQNRIQQILP